MAVVRATSVEVTLQPRATGKPEQMPSIAIRHVSHQCRHGHGRRVGFGASPHHRRSAVETRALGGLVAKRPESASAPERTIRFPEARILWGGKPVFMRLSVPAKGVNVSPQFLLLFILASRRHGSDEQQIAWQSRVNNSLFSLVTRTICLSPSMGVRTTRMLKHYRIIQGLSQRKKKPSAHSNR